MLRSFYTITTLFVLIILCAQYSSAQTSATLLAQSPDGKSVRLGWYVNIWSSDITGFDIKRKTSGGEWVKLNQQPITIEIARTKEIRNVENDPQEAIRLKTKLGKMIADKKIAETPQTVFLQRLNADTNMVRDMAMVTAIDYDIALFMGFAYIDHSLTANGNYEYGLFIQGTDKLLAKANYTYGTRENADVITEIKAKKIPRSNKIQLTWKANKDKMAASNVIGYYIFRNDIKTGGDPWLASEDGGQQYIWTDSTAIGENRYSISAVTALGIEGNAKTYNYYPTDFTPDYKTAELDNIIWQDNDMKTILRVTWQFPKDFERYIKGFYVEKDRMPEGYKQISELLSPSARIFVPTAREFVDTTPISLKSYVRFRVVVLYNDDVEITGSEKRFYYYPSVQPPKPENLKADVTRDDDKLIVNLNWDPPRKEDTLTDYYLVYASDPITERLYLEMGITPPIKISKYKYEIQYSKANKYAFCTQAVGINRVESTLSDTASLLVPSMVLPVPDIKNVTLDSNKVTIKWDFPDILDLKGFRIYQNKNLIAGEFDVAKAKREFTTPALRWNSNYAFTVQAVSESGIISEISIPAYITIIPQ